jgi:hypothetical protein
MTNSAIPNPGSAEARTRGCTCPVIDNGHGRGYMGGIKDKAGAAVFVYTAGCPVHNRRSPTVAEPPHAD